MAGKSARPPLVFADTLSGLRQFLLPIPQAAIEDVLSRTNRPTLH
jgi:hypothetical protein